MIGREIKSLRHFISNVGGKPKFVLFSHINNLNLGCFVKKGETIYLFNNLTGKHYNHDYLKKVLNFSDEMIPSFAKFIYVMSFNDAQVCYRLGNHFIEVPDDFIENYNNFISANKKKLQPIITKYIAEHATYQYMIYNYVEESANLFVWAIVNYVNNSVPWSLLKNVLLWLKNNASLSKELELHTVTAYNGLEQVIKLYQECITLKIDKQANTVINTFNTAQKKILKSAIKYIDQKKLLFQFSKLSLTKKQNFIRKMSTVENADDILTNINYLVKSHFKWDKKDFLQFFNNCENFKAKIIIDKDNWLLIEVNDFDTIKCLAKNTNWCISKNKQYWNQYMRSNSIKQYLLMDFECKEDNEYSIVGFTVNEGEITNAHSYTNANIMRNGEMEGDDLCEYFSYRTDAIKLQPFVEIPLPKIYQILNSKNIDISIFKSQPVIPFNWDIESFQTFLKTFYYDYEYKLVIKDKIAFCKFNSEKINWFCNYKICQKYNIVPPYTQVYFYVKLNFNHDVLGENDVLCTYSYYNENTKSLDINPIFNINGKLYNNSLKEFMEGFLSLEEYKTNDVISDNEVIFHLQTYNFEYLEKNIDKVKSFFNNEYLLTSSYNSKIAFQVICDSIFRYYSADLINFLHKHQIDFTANHILQLQNNIIYDILSRSIQFISYEDINVNTLSLNRIYERPKVKIVVAYLNILKKIHDFPDGKKCIHHVLIQASNDYYHTNHLFWNFLVKNFLFDLTPEECVINDIFTNFLMVLKASNNKELIEHIKNLQPEESSQLKQHVMNVCCS